MSTKYTKQQIEKMIIAECKKWGVDPALALGIAKHESGLRADAVSPKNTDGTVDKGVFQLNSKYFKLKNPLDPAENISRGVQHIAALQKTFGTDTNKILAAYNAGAGAVQSGKIPKSTLEKYIPNALKQIRVYKASTNPETGEIGNTIPVINNNERTAMNNKDTMTGAASNVELPQEVQAMLAPSGTLSADNLVKLLQEARKNEREAYQDYYNNIMQPALTVYDTPSVRVGTDEQGNPIMITPRQYEDLKKQQLLADLQQNRNQAYQTINPYSDTATQYSQNMYDRLNQAYQGQMDAIGQQYATGYQGMSPEELRREANRIAGINLGVAAGTGNPAATAAAIQNMHLARQQADIDAYKQAIANQYGMPYEQVMAMQQARAGAAQNYINQLTELSKQDMSRLGTSATAAGNLYGKDVEMTKALLDDINKMRDFEQSVRDKYGDRYADLIIQQMKNNPDYLKAILGYQSPVDVANINRSGDIATGIIAGEYGIGKQKEANVGSENVANINQAGNMARQQLEGSQKYETKQMELEHPTTVIPKLLGAYNDAALFNPNLTPAQYFSVVPTGLVNTYLPNANIQSQQEIPQQEIPQQTPTSRGGLFSRFMGGFNLGNQ